MAVALILSEFLLNPWTGYGQQASSSQDSAADSSAAAAAVQSIEGLSAGSLANNLLHVPVSNLYPGTVPAAPPVTSPVAGDPAAAERGMKDFLQFNCVGCHASNGAGGMGPALSNRKFIYGGSDQNIYLTILQGRPNGMPAWGGMLPDSVIWDLVAYIQSISAEPQGEWGKTTSTDGFTIEQVPAEKLQVVDPWNHTEKFSYGQAPDRHGEPAPPPPAGS
ncbi:MAG: c-type cytochrome [Devosia sp.]